MDIDCLFNADGAVANRFPTASGEGKTPGMAPANAGVLRVAVGMVGRPITLPSTPSD